MMPFNYDQPENEPIGYIEANAGLGLAKTVGIIVALVALVALVILPQFSNIFAPVITALH